MLCRAPPCLILAICCLGLSIVSLDNTIVNITLPAFRADLDAAGGHGGRDAAMLKT